MQFDIDRAQARYQERWRARMETSPDSLSAVINLGYALLNVHRYEQALRLVELALHGAESGTSPPYQDVGLALGDAMYLRAKAVGLPCHP